MVFKVTNTSPRCSWQSLRKNGRRSAVTLRRSDRLLGIETLEARQLMAADSGRDEMPVVAVPPLPGQRSAASVVAPFVASRPDMPRNEVLPTAPRLTAAAASTSSIRLSWNNVAGERGYQIFMLNAATGAWDQIGTVAANRTSFVATRLTAGTGYTFRVAAFNAVGSQDSNLASATTRGVAPLVAPSVSIAPVSDSSISLWWNDVASEQGYRVQRWNAESGTWVVLANLGANSTGYTDTGLAGSTGYTYKVTAFNGSRTVDSDATSATTLVPQPTAPDLSVTSISSSSVSLSWSNVANETGYRVFQWNSQGGGWSQIGETEADRSFFTVTGLAGGTQYLFKVSAYNAAGGAESSAVSVTTQIDRPSAPTLSATAVSSSAVSLTWNDVANEDGYRILQWRGGSWAHIATTGAGATGFTVSGLAAGTTYTFIVVAYNTAGSAESFMVSATTQVDRPSAPSLSASAASSSLINLTWNDVANEDGYRILRWNGGSWTQIATVGSGSSSFAASGLEGGTSYTFMVVAYNAAGSAESNMATATTQVARPSAPVVSATAVATSSIRLDWNDVSNESGYRILQWNGNSWVQLAVLSANTTTCVVSSLASGTTYSFKVIAYNTVGSAESQSASATTFFEIVRPRAATSYYPAQGSLFGSDGAATFWDVRQGRLGNCWLMAGLAAIAARQPSVIESMFVYRGQSVQLGYTVDVYDVRLFDTSRNVRWVTVDTLLPSGGNYYAQTNGDCLWVGLAERAYAQAADRGWVATSSSNAGLSGYARLDSGYSSWALAAFMNRAPFENQLSSFSAQAAQAWNVGVPYTLGTGQQTHFRLFSTHAYALVGYDPSSAYPYQIFNPHNSGAYSGNGQQYGGLFQAQAGFVARPNFVLSMYANSVGSGTETFSTDVGAELLAVVSEGTLDVRPGVVIDVEPRSVAAPAPAPAAAERVMKAAAVEVSFRSAAFATFVLEGESTASVADGEPAGITASAWRSMRQS